MPSMHLSQTRKWFLNSPPAEWAIFQLRELLLGALRQGPIPQHVAFVMDGNRRFAKLHGIETIEGHSIGFEALMRILEVCYKTGVKVVTIYAFSIENFKRSKYEVDGLMDMFKTKLAQVCQHGGIFERYGACLKILGRRDVLKPDVLELMDKAEKMTANNGNAILNVCFSYTSQDEITGAIRDSVVEYSKPIASNLPRPFSQSHITHTIRSRHLASSSASASLDHLRAPSPLADSTSTSDTEGSITSNSTTQHHSPAPSTTTSIDSPSPIPHHQTSNSTSALPLPSPSSKPLLTTTLQTSKSCNSFLSPLPLPTSSSQSPPQTYPDPESITSRTLSDHMYTAHMPPLDLLVRTSGVERLSDFMLWQCHQGTEIAFLKVLWPEFDLWSFLPVLLEWQWRRRREGLGRR